MGVDSVKIKLAGAELRTSLAAAVARCAELEGKINELEKAAPQPATAVERLSPDFCDGGAFALEHEDLGSGIRKLSMHIGEETYPVYLGYRKLPALVAELGKLEFDQVFLGYDEVTAKACGPQLEEELTKQGIVFQKCVMGLTEAAKNFSTLDMILETFLKGGVSRRSIILPVGGGIVSNTFGLAAGLLFRGIRLVHLPTSFLNAHDAAASSQKQGVNHAGYKNVIGVFHKPVMVLIDTFFYESLGEVQMKAGLGELTKNAALFGGVHYDLIKKTTLAKGWKLTGDELVEATHTGIAAKDMLLRWDPREKHIALLFEYGHTIGHAIEMTRGVVISHGEAVTFGMLGASYISSKLGLMTCEDRTEHDALVEALEPTVTLPSRDIEDEVLDKVLHDNKRGYVPEKEGFCPFILCRRIGELHKPNAYYLEHVPVDIVREAIRHTVHCAREREQQCAASAPRWRHCTIS